MDVSIRMDYGGIGEVLDWSLAFFGSPSLVVGDEGLYVLLLVAGEIFVIA